MIISLIQFWAPVYGIDTLTAEAVAIHESQLNPNAIGAAGEIGIFQLKSQYVSQYTRKELFDPQTNVIAGLQKLAEAKRTCVHQNDIEYLICYNVGATNAKKYKHPELAPYVVAVKRGMASL